MPTALQAIFGADARPFERELARAEAVSAGYSRRMGRGFAGNFKASFVGLQDSFAASMSAINQQIGGISGFKQTIDKIRGNTTMSAEESAAMDGRILMEQKLARARSMRISQNLRLSQEAAVAEQRAVMQVMGAEIEQGILEQKLARAKSMRIYQNLRLSREAAAAEVAANKAAQLAMLADVARAGGVAGNLGGGSHSMGTGGGGFAGVVRESLVILREASRGNWTRMAGSVTLLAQYTGLLGTVIKSTAAESVKLATTQNAVAASSARAALAEESKAKAVYDDALAQGLDEAAATQLARSNTLLAASARAAAIGEAQKAEAATAAAETELAAATASLGPIGWIAAALIAVGVAAYFIVRHYRVLAEEQRNLNALMTAGKTSYEAQADAMDRAADSARSFARWLDELGRKEDTLADKAKRAVDQIKQQADVDQALRDQNKENALTQVDYDEKTGVISQPEAVRKKAEIEKQAADAAAKAKQDELNAESDKLSEFRNKAEQERNAAVTKAKAAETALETSPENTALKGDEDQFKKAEQLVTDLEKHAADKGLDEFDVQHIESGGVKYGVSLNKAKADAEILRQKMEADKAGVATQENSVTDAKQKAQTAEASLKSITDSQREAANAANQNAKNAPALLAAQQKGIEERAAIEPLNGKRSAGYGLNQAQRVGAYAATPPEARTQIDILRRIESNTGHLKPEPHQPPNHTPTRFGPHQRR